MGVVSTPQRASVERLAAESGLGRVGTLHPLAGGANNQVFRADTDRGPVVVKLYFHHPGDIRNRLATETAFVRLAWDGGIRCVPRLLGSDPAHHLALYDHIPGPPVAVPAITHVDEALAFFVALQELRDRAAALPAASEACFTLIDHQRTVERRLQRLSQLSTDTPSHAEAARLVADEALPRWRALMGKSPADPALPLAATERCLSPSDFGFHNALTDAGGRLVFFDFEYAGWDDPAKLVGDFFHQVAVPAPADLYLRFRDRVATLFPDPPAVAARCDRLQPIYAMKWVTILLNDFLPTGNRRRTFAHPPGSTENGTGDRHRRQLAKARAALARFDALSGVSP